MDGGIVIASLLGDSNLYKKLPKHVRGWGCQVCHEKTVPTGKLLVTILIFLIVHDGLTQPLIYSSHSIDELGLEVATLYEGRWVNGASDVHEIP